MEQNQVVLIFEDGADHAPWSHVRGIRIRANGVTRETSLDSIRQFFDLIDRQKAFHEGNGPRAICPEFDDGETFCKGCGEHCDTHETRDQCQIEQQQKTIDALKLTIEVMSKTIGDQRKENEKLEHTLKAIYDGADPLNLPDDPWVKAGRRMVIADNIKSPIEVAAPEHVPVLFLKVTNPDEGDLAEASEVLKHWRPNFEIVKTNLRDCNKPEKAGDT